jgi:hypothetical protein
MANRPSDRSMMAAASSVFYPRDVERFLENLDFRGLAAEQALQLAHPSFQLTDTARADDIFVSLDRLQAAFQHSSTPVEQQAGTDARSPGHVGHRHPGLHRLLDQPDLLGGRPTATPLD